MKYFTENKNIEPNMWFNISLQGYSAMQITHNSKDVAYYSISSVEPTDEVAHELLPGDCLSKVDVDIWLRSNTNRFNLAITRYKE